MTPLDRTAAPAHLRTRITDAFRDWAAQTPRRTAVVVGESDWSYGVLLNAVEQVAAQVAHLEPGKFAGTWAARFGADLPWVGLLSANRIAFLQVFLGTAMAGGVAMVLSPRWGMAQLQAVLRRYPPDWLVGEPGLLPSLTVSGAAPLPASPTSLVTLPPPPPSPLPSQAPVPDLAPLAPADGDRPFYACFTSGTTGLPKGILKTHRSWLDGLAASRQEFGIGPADQVFVPGGLSHSLSLYAAVEALCAGATLHLLPHILAVAAVSHLQRHAITVVVAVPTLLHLLAAEATAQARRFPSVRLIISGGAKLTPKLGQTLSQVFPQARVVEYYGASELGFVSLRSSTDAIPAASVGRSFAGVELSVQRQDGSGEAAPGEVGWVGVRSTLTCVGYLDGHLGPPGFRNVNGWWTVGDRGWRDEQGYLYLRGREQEMLVCAGVNVFPSQVEAALLALPQVAAAVVLGLSDDCRGDVIHAVLVWQDRPLARRSLRQRLRPYLDRHACPRRFYALPALPLTASGKVARALLMQQLERGELAPFEIR